VIGIFAYIRPHKGDEWLKARWRIWVQLGAALCAPTAAVAAQHTAAYAAPLTLSIGATGTTVQQLQNALRTLGYLHGAADGIFGQATRDAVLAFQRAHQLTPDGVAGPKTWAALIRALGTTSGFATAVSRGEVVTKAPVHTPPSLSSASKGTGPSYPGSPLRQGDRGTAVKQVQQRLHDLGYSVGTIDGVFGSKTSAGVKAFQREHHLTADGVVGPATWNALFSASSASGASRSGGTTPQTGTGRSSTTTPAAGGGSPGDNSPSGSNASAGTSAGNVSSRPSPGGSNEPVDYIEWASPSAAPSAPMTRSAAEARMTNDNAAAGQRHLAPEAFVVQASTKVMVDLPIDYFYETVSGTWMHHGSDFRGKPFTVSAGPAPSWAQPGVLYVATDNGQSPFYVHFYQIGIYDKTATPANGNVTLVGPVDMGLYENPFRLVDLRTPAPSSITSSVIDQWLQWMDSPLAGLGGVFLDAQRRYGVNAVYLAAHAFHETGTAKLWSSASLPVARNNLYGYQAYDNNTGAAAYFPSQGYAVEFQAWFVRYDYLDPGAYWGYPARAAGKNLPTLDGMYYYATDRNWSSQIATYMAQLSAAAHTDASDYVAYQPAQAMNDDAAQHPLAEPTYLLAGASATVTADTVAFSDWQMRPELRMGASGPWVAEMQRLLNNFGASLTVDGDFGAATAAALRSFQQSQGLVADGDCGPQTWMRLSSPTTTKLSKNLAVKVDQVRLADGRLIYHVTSQDGRSGWVDGAFIQLNNVYKLAFAKYDNGYALSNGSGHSLRVGDEVVYDPATQVATCVDQLTGTVFTITVPRTQMVQVTH
jgi:peptidoglycan hydrolase-like protein with peptidoglycan-binding domain/beta-N-acetylglucosaminidase